MLKKEWFLEESTSGALATVTNVRLVSDLSATLIGSYFIPDGNNVNHPRFECGTKTFTLTNDIDNNQDDATTIAEESFSAKELLKQFKKILFLLEMQELNLRMNSRAGTLIEILELKL